MNKLLLFFIVFLSFSHQKLYATHALGGDLMYEQISPTQYAITLRIYRDCNGIALNNNATINWSGTCGSGSRSATRISNIDITPLCPNLPTACAGGSGSIGIEEHIYTTVITVPAGCNDINFNYTLCCRNNIITTLIDPGNENIFLYTEHVNTAIVNHSPYFNNYPSPIVCVNQPVVYNHGVYDPDGDSLYFFQGNCYEALNNPIEYLAGYSGVTPLTTVNPIVLNPNTGAITFTPNIQQVGVMCIVVQEFRNGILIGETIRDIQFNVIACNNVPPVSSGINNQPGVDSLDFMISICANSQVCFDLSFSDVDMDVLTVGWNNEISDATFQVFNNSTITPTGQFCWSPNATDIGLNFFSINIQDDACPIVGSSTYTYTVQVLPNPNSLNLTYDNTVCVFDTNEIVLSSSPNAIDSVYWSPSPSLLPTSITTADVFPNGAATYTVAAFFTDGCLVIDSASFTMSAPPIVVANANTTNICNGGTIVLTGSGADSYTWSNGGIDGVPFVPPVGITTYYVTGLDSNACTNVDSIQVSVNPILYIASLPGSTLCEGETLTLSGSGASIYTWNNGVVNGVPFTPPVGTTTYILTGTDVNGCVSQDSIDITVNPLPAVEGRSDQLTYCEGGSVLLTGQNALTYIWDNGVTDDVAFIQVPGTVSYTVIGTDSLGCINTDTISVTVYPLPIVHANTGANDVCEGASISLTGSGAQTYVWNNGVVDGQAFVPSVGTNTFIVTGTDVNGCISQDSIDITVNPLPNVVANTITNNICDGFTATLTGSGAQSYVWDNGIMDGVSFVPSLGTTTYAVIGTDVNGCISQDSINILVNPLPQIFVSASANTNYICDGQSLILTATGAQSFSWNNGVVNGVSFIPPVGTTDYIVTGINANSCYNYDTVQVTVNPLPTIVINASDTNVCIGESITLNGSGATSYVWNNGITDGVSFTPALGNTSYTLSATDANGCINTESVSVVVNPLPIVQANTSDNNLCASTSVVLSGSGAQTYTWNNGVIDGFSFIPVVGVTNYTVVGTDLNGCENTANVDITVNPLPIITINASSNGSALCEGDELTLTASGAQSYSWNNGVSNGIAFVPPVGNNTYIVTGTDSNGCINSDTVVVVVNPLPSILAITSANNICDNESITLIGSGAQSYTWNNGVVDGVSFVPPVGTTVYTVTGTDSNGCISMDSIDIVVNPLPIITANASATTTCEADSIILTGSGGQSYVWDNGALDGLAFVPPVGTTTYTVTGTDMNGCVSNDNISILVNPLPSITAITSANNVCDNDNITLTASGAQSYTWNNGVINGISFVPPVGTTTYIVTGTDINGCISEDSIDILVNPLPSISINTSGNNICEGFSITLNGNGAQSYTWNNGVVDGVSFAPPVGTTNYIVNATDTNLCQNTDSIAILVNPLPQVGAISNGNNFCDGYTVVLSGTGAQSYIWNNNGVDGVAFVPSIGTTTYTVTGTDNNGCQNQANIDITVNPLPPVAVVANTNGNVLCDGAAITLSGSGALSYSWNNGVQDGISFVPAVGTTSYVLTGIDTNACLNYDTIEIVVNPLPVVTAYLSANNVCDGDSVILSCSNLAFHSWNYNVIDGVPFVPPVGTTTYILSATDFNGCANDDSIDVIVNPLPNVLANSTANQVCDGNTVALFGTGASAYVWDNGVQNNVSFVPPLGYSTYKVVGTDTNGCVNEDDITIQTLNLPVVNPISSDNNVCEGELVTLIGAGAQSYTWNNGVLNGVPFVPAVGVNTYVVTGVDGNACSSMDTIEVTVNPLPTVLANASSTSICDGESITLFGSGANTYTWANGLLDGASVTPSIGLNIFEVTGTDLYGCVNNDTIAILTNSLGELNALEDVIVCDVAYIDIATNSTNIVAYQWGIIENGVASELLNSIQYIGVQTDQLHVSDLTASLNYTFYVELTGACGNLLYDTMNLVANQGPQIDLLQDTTFCIHESNVVFADVTGTNITWSDGTVGQYLSPAYTGVYYVSFEEIGTNCIVSDTLYIEMEDCIENCVLVAPTGFSPNGDGANDGFRAIHTCGEGMSYYDMKIYNRWGELVFRTDDPMESWDGIYKGEKAPVATYGFVIDYIKEYNYEKEMISGNVSLIR